MTKRRKPAEPRRFWTRKEVALVRCFYPWIATQEIADELGRSLNTVYQKAAKMGLAKSEEYLASPDACRLRRGDKVGAATRFAKGHVPANKGLRRPGYAPGRMRETQFGKGQLNGVAALRCKPVGALRLIDGYLYRKVSAKPGPWSVNWKPEHVLTWEKAHASEVGRGFCIVFRDGDKTHVELANLERISRQELARRNSIHRLPEELKEVIRLKGAINHRLTTRERRMQHGKEQIERSARPSLRNTGSAEGQGQRDGDRAGQGDHRSGRGHHPDGRGRSEVRERGGRAA